MRTGLPWFTISFLSTILFFIPNNSPSAAPIQQGGSIGPCDPDDPAFDPDSPDCDQFVLPELIAFEREADEVDQDTAQIDSQANGHPIDIIYAHELPECGATATDELKAAAAAGAGGVLSPASPDIALINAQAALEAAKSNLALADKILDRDRRLATTRVISTEQLETSRQKRTDAAAEVKYQENQVAFYQLVILGDVVPFAALRRFIVRAAYNAQVAAADAKLDAAKEGASTAKVRLDRARVLRARGAISQEDLDRAVNAKDLADIEVTRWTNIKNVYKNRVDNP